MGFRWLRAQRKAAEVAERPTKTAESRRNRGPAEANDDETTTDFWGTVSGIFSNQIRGLVFLVRRDNPGFAQFPQPTVLEGKRSGQARRRAGGEGWAICE